VSSLVLDPGIEMAETKTPVLKEYRVCYQRSINLYKIYSGWRIVRGVDLA
jgi:hypothetical protein